MKTTNKNYELWRKIRDFQLDDPNAKFQFSDKLAKEQGWSKSYTLRTIEEYKKFIFLICTTGNSCSPSDDVDQVWHMHLIYTKSYWNDFCRTTLEREIHHSPSKGGQKETESFKFQYEETKNLYENYFEEKAPEDIWPSTDKRFQFHFRKVDLREYVLIPKPKFSKLSSIGTFSFLGLFGFGCSNSDSGIGNFLLGILLIFGSMRLIGLMFSDSNNNQNGRRKKINRNIHSKNSVWYPSNTSNVVLSDIGTGDTNECNRGDRDTNGSGGGDTSGCNSGGGDTSGCNSGGGDSSGCSSGCGSCGGGGD